VLYFEGFAGEGFVKQIVNVFCIYFKNHGKYKIYRNILTENQIKQTLSNLEYPRLTG
jgi:hypothetical protein